MRKGNSLIIVLVVVIVLAVGLLYLARMKFSTNYQNTTNTTTSSYQVSSGSTNSDLQQDLNTIDSSLKDTTNSQTSVNQGINDTPIAQPQ